MTDNLMAYALQEAVATAKEEAKATPIALGELVGHTTSTASGTLVAYDGDEVVIQPNSGETVRWKTVEMVDINRVFTLTNQYAERLEQLAEMVGLMDMLGVSPQETLEMMLGGQEDVGPTPGCDCPHCAVYSPEQHEAARLKLEAQVNSLPTLSETPQSDSKFPFNDFLKSVGE